MEVDPSIKAIILKIDSAAHDYIVEDLDDQTLVIKESQLQKLKARLEEVSKSFCVIVYRDEARERKGKERKGRKLTNPQKELANTQQMPDDSASD